MAGKKGKGGPRSRAKTAARRNGARDQIKPNGALAADPRSTQRELDNAIRRYMDLYEFAPIGYTSFDRVGRVEEMNLMAAQLLGRDRDPLIGKPFALYVAKQDTERFLKHLLECRLGENRVETELQLLRSNGTQLAVLLSSTPTSSSIKDGALLYQTAIVDLTRRKLAEGALRESEELHRALISQTTVGMSRSNLKGKLVFVNRTLCEMLGYTEEELLGKSIIDVTHPDDTRESRRTFVDLISKGKPYRLEKRYRRKDGSYLWVIVSASPMRDASGKTIAAVSVVVDITDRKQTELALHEAKALLELRVKERTAELLAANEELQNEAALRKRLEGEILTISDREQRRLGQDLHDSLCQHLTATAFLARAIAVRLKDHRVIEVADLEKIVELINAGVTEARTISRGLHPVEMDPSGLTAALQSLLHQQSRLPYRLDLDEDIGISDPTVALHLYRIAREAVINANKHSAARELLVRMRRSGKEIELSVTDDGVGIAKNRGDGSGMGFHIMDYRARTIGARLEIKPVKPHGTRVACYIRRK